MEKNATLNTIRDIIEKHPVNKHDEDHNDLRNVLLMIVSFLEGFFEKSEGQENTNAEIWGSILELGEKVNANKGKINENKIDIQKIGIGMNNLMKQYPKISTMQKLGLLMDGENIIDTVNIESGRYLLVKSINPTDWNEFAKLDKTFSWEIIEVTNDEYDIKIGLDTNTEGETATMTVNVDLLFIKF